MGGIGRTVMYGTSALLLSAVLSGCGSVATPVSQVSSPAVSTPSVVATTTPTAAGGNAAVLAAVDALPVKGRAPKTGYTRDEFGPAWKDVDGNKCDTRNDVLRRDLVNVTYQDSSTCVIQTGVLENDPYTGKTINFTRGSDTSSAIQIDHLVALSDAWQKGAQQWDDTKRTAFANDPLNLLSADGPANQGKGDGDTATWLPANTAFRCEYVARQVAVKTKYGVWVTDAEQQAMRDVLTGCPDQQLPADVSAEVVVPPMVTK